MEFEEQQDPESRSSKDPASELAANSFPNALPVGEDQAATLPPEDPPTILHARPPDSNTRATNRRNAKKPSRFLHSLLQEELVEFDSSSDFNFNVFSA